MTRTNKVLFTISCILVAISLFLSIQISYSAPVLEELFQSFDTEIAGNTSNLLQYHYLGLIAPILALFACIFFIRSKLNQTSKNIVYALSVITFENLHNQCKIYQAELGYFSKREFVGIFKKANDVRVFWKQWYTKSTDEYVAFIHLKNNNGKIEVVNVSVS